MEGFGVGLFHFDLFHPVEVFDLGLGEGRLVFLVAEFFNQSLQSLDILLLALIGLLQALQVVFLLDGE